MARVAVKKVEKIKVIDQMLEDFAGEEFEDYENGYDALQTHQKHYSSDEDYMMDIDDLY